MLEGLSRNFERVTGWAVLFVLGAPLVCPQRRSMVWVGGCQKKFASIDARELAFCLNPLKVRRGFPNDLRYALPPANVDDFESRILFVNC